MLSYTKRRGQTRNGTHRWLCSHAPLIESCIPNPLAECQNVSIAVSNSKLSHPIGFVCKLKHWFQLAYSLIELVYVFHLNVQDGCPAKCPVHGPVGSRQLLSQRRLDNLLDAGMDALGHPLGRALERQPQLGRLELCRGQPMSPGHALVQRLRVPIQTSNARLPGRRPRRPRPRCGLSRLIPWWSLMTQPVSGPTLSLSCRGCKRDRRQTCYEKSLKNSGVRPSLGFWSQSCC